MASWPQAAHVFEADHIVALRAAEAAGRPLLVRGDPGTGKSQLAHAAAVAAQRQFLPLVVDARTEATDMMWRFDAVARLADAHLASVPGSGAPTGLDVAAYLQPGAMWWAFNWEGALRQANAARIKVTVPKLPPRTLAGHLKRARCCWLMRSTRPRLMCPMACSRRWAMAASRSA